MQNKQQMSKMMPDWTFDDLIKNRHLLCSVCIASTLQMQFYHSGLGILAVFLLFFRISCLRFQSFFSRFSFHYFHFLLIVNEFVNFRYRQFSFSLTESHTGSLGT